MWRNTDPQGNEAAKIKWELVPYMRGRALDLGCGPHKVFPHFKGVDNGKAFGIAGIDVPVETCERLAVVPDRSADCVFSSHLLEHIEFDSVPATLAEWCRVIMGGGYLILYLPDENEYPRVGCAGANPDHKWNVNYEKVIAAMETVQRDWDLIDFQKRNEGFEYSLFFVFKIS